MFLPKRPPDEELSEKERKWYDSVDKKTKSAENFGKFIMLAVIGSIVLIGLLKIFFP